MDTKKLHSLRPVADTSSEIKAAIERINTARAEAVAAAATARAELAAGALILDSKRRRALTDEAEDCDLDVRQADGLLEALQEPLREALAREKQQADAARQAELLARLEQHVARFQAEYPSLHEPLAALKAERGALIAAIDAHNEDARGHCIELGVLRVEFHELALIQTPDEREWNSPQAVNQRRLNAIAEQQRAHHENLEAIRQRVAASRVEGEVSVHRTTTATVTAG
jgi:chromosome segregation ATPase